LIENNVGGIGTDHKWGAKKYVGAFLPGEIDATGEIRGPLRCKGKELGRLEKSGQSMSEAESQWDDKMFLIGRSLWIVKR